MKPRLKNIFFVVAFISISFDFFFHYLLLFRKVFNEKFAFQIKLNLCLTFALQNTPFKTITLSNISRRRKIEDFACFSSSQFFFRIEMVNDCNIAIELVDIDMNMNNEFAITLI